MKDWPHPSDPPPLSRLEMVIIALLVALPVGAMLFGLVGLLR
jgi:hypothetical protein